MPATFTSIPWPVGIVGAGWLGRALAHALARQVGAPREDAVLATTRSGQWAKGAEEQGGPPPHVDLAAWDSGSHDADQLRQHLAGARSVFVAWSSGGGDQDRREVYIEGAKKFLAAIDGLELERVVYASSTSALPNVDAWLDEDCPAWPLKERGKVQREAEELIAETLTARRTPWVVLRFGGLYGPGRDLGRLYKLDPTRQLPGDGNAPTNLIHRDDAVTSILAALTLDPETSAIVHAVDDDHCTRRQMYQRLSELANSPAPVWEKKPPEGVEGIGKRVGNRRLKTLLRVELKHPVHLPEAPR